MLKSKNIHAEKLVAISEGDAGGGLKFLAIADSAGGRRGGGFGNFLATARNYQPHLPSSLHLHHRELQSTGGASRHAAPHAEVPLGLDCVSWCSSPGSRSGELDLIGGKPDRIGARRTPACSGLVRYSQRHVFLAGQRSCLIYFGKGEGAARRTE